MHPLLFPPGGEKFQYFNIIQADTRDFLPLGGDAAERQRGIYNQE
jgi:hypothetical protein